MLGFIKGVLIWIVGFFALLGVGYTYASIRVSIKERKERERKYNEEFAYWQQMYKGKYNKRPSKNKSNNADPPQP